MLKKNIGIGLLGIGTIGSGVARVLTEKSSKLKSETGTELVLRKILEKDVSKHGSAGISKKLFTSKFDSIVNDPDIDIVIELIGGEDPALKFIKECLVAGKSVVTANKEVLAKHGYELFKIAHKNSVDLRYEASVGGGIPLISPFLFDLVANDILAIHGIVNGTTNYILTRMAQDGLDFSVALKQAQKMGYAEANPSNDVEGTDAAYKLAIMATIAFGTEVTEERVYREGISRLKACDFKYARELGYAIKLLAIAKLSNGHIETRVHPVFIPEEALLAKVDGVFNAISVEGDLVGNVIFYGKGAGSQPTSSAVIGDVVNVARNILRGVKHYPVLPTTNHYKIEPMVNVETRYYIRMRTLDQSGVLAQISKVLGDNEISIASVIQKETDIAGRTAEIVIMTHPAKEEALQKALKLMKRLKVVKDVSNYVRVEDQYQ
jgi:homoserine dehydrogenase